MVYVSERRGNCPESQCQVPISTPISNYSLLAIDDDLPPLLIYECHHGIVDASGCGSIVDYQCPQKCEEGV